MISIIDYGLGNVGAFFNIYREMNIDVRYVKNRDELKGSTKLILPGVGSFDLAMKLFQDSGMSEAVTEMVFNQKIPILGICVGMQMLADSSDEGHLPGLGWIPGKVKKIDESNIKQRTHLPHMGWNDIVVRGKNLLFQGLEKDAKFYFLHSYFFDSANSETVLADVEYGNIIPCAVGSDNVYGVQFHPEKSHSYGAKLLKNFAEL